jgi:hypothetical protein
MMHAGATVGKLKETRQTIAPAKPGFTRPTEAQGLKTSEFHRAAGDDSAAPGEGGNLIFFL